MVIQCLKLKQGLMDLNGVFVCPHYALRMKRPIRSTLLHPKCDHELPAHSPSRGTQTVSTPPIQSPDSSRFSTAFEYCCVSQAVLNLKLLIKNTATRRGPLDNAHGTTDLSTYGPNECSPPAMAEVQDWLVPSFMPIAMLNSLSAAMSDSAPECCSRTIRVPARFSPPWDPTHPQERRAELCSSSHTSHVGVSTNVMERLLRFARMFLWKVLWCRGG